MGVFTTRLRILNPAEPSRSEEFDVVVDTGASFSWVSRERLERLGIRPTRRMKFRTIEGRIIEREVAPVFVAIDGQAGGDNAVIAEPGEMEVMGAYTMEALGLAVDMAQQKLVPTIGLALASPTQ